MKMYTGNIFQFSCLIITENTCSHEKYKPSITFQALPGLIFYIIKFK
jgi:hypothetical protein